MSCLASCASSAAPVVEAPSTTKAPRPPHITATLDVTGSAPGAPVIRGDVSLRFDAVAGARVTLDARGFEDVVATSEPAGAWTYDGKKLVGRLSEATSGPVVVTVRYTARPARGVTVTDDAIWTAFHTWEWLPCVSDSSWRATLDLTVRAPEGWTTLATGDGDAHPGADLVRTSPHPAYTFGFAAGVFEGDVSPESRLDVWGATPTQSQLVRARTLDAMSSWEDTFGVDAFLGDRYVQVFVPGRAYQELAGMAFMSRGYLGALEADAKEDWLIVHELAHQRWGNLVTCETWGDFWLNEALVTWWVGRQKLIRGDQEGYDREISLWEKRVASALEKGADPRIARPGADVEGAGGSIVYHAGALLLLRLERMVGTSRFDQALGELMERGGVDGSGLGTRAFLDALELTPEQRAQVECQLADAGAGCFE